MEYSVVNSINGVEWVIELKTHPERRTYRETLHFSSEEVEKCPLEMIIGQMEEALHKVMTRAIREEVFGQHVKGLQKANPKIKGNSRLETDSSSVDSVFR